MGTTGRNIAGVIAALVTWYLVLGILVSIDLALRLSPTEAHSAAGFYLLHLSTVWPWFVASALMGCVVAVTLHVPRGPLVAAALAVGLKLSSYRYIAPDWQMWAMAIVEVLLVGAMAAGAFLLVRRLRRGGMPPAAGDVERHQAAA